MAALVSLWDIRQARQQAQEEAAIAKAVTDFLTNDLLAQASPYENARTKKVTVEEVLGRAAARIAGKFAQQPLVESRPENCQLFPSGIAESVSSL